MLAGELADQAALYGVLAQIEAFGLELLEAQALCRRASDRRGSAESNDDG